jgi:hypothetical protein
VARLFILHFLEKAQDEFSAAMLTLPVGVTRKMLSCPSSLNYMKSL